MDRPTIVILGAGLGGAIAAYEIRDTLGERARIVVDGHELIIDAPGASSARRYVAGVTIDGAPLSVPRLTQADLRTAHAIAFTMADAPTTWGR